MAAIEVVYQNNSKEWFGYIDEDDVYKIDTSHFPWSEIPEVNGKTQLSLSELQKLARSLFGEVRTQRKEIQSGYIREVDEVLEKLEEKYIDYTV